MKDQNLQQPKSDRFFAALGNVDFPYFQIK